MILGMSMHGWWLKPGNEAARCTEVVVGEGQPSGRRCRNKVCNRQYRTGKCKVHEGRLDMRSFAEYPAVLDPATSRFVQHDAGATTPKPTKGQHPMKVTTRQNEPEQGGGWSAWCEGISAAGTGDTESDAIGSLACLLGDFVVGHKGRIDEQDAKLQRISAIVDECDPSRRPAAEGEPKEPAGVTMHLSAEDLATLGRLQQEQAANPLRIVIDGSRLAEICKARQAAGIQVMVAGAPCTDRETIARCVFQALRSNGIVCSMLDADSAPLGSIDPGENIRRLHAFRDAQNPDSPVIVNLATE